jgi:hypothetical protein
MMENMKLPKELLLIKNNVNLPNSETLYIFKAYAYV